METDSLYKLNEVVEMTGISRSKLYNMIKSGELPAFKVRKQPGQKGRPHFLLHFNDFKHMTDIEDVQVSCLPWVVGITVLIVLIGVILLA